MAGPSISEGSATIKLHITFMGEKKPVPKDGPGLPLPPRSRRNLWGFAAVSSEQEQTYTNSHPLVEDTPAEDLHSLQKEAVLSSCNFATAHLHFECVSPFNFATHETEDPFATPQYCPHPPFEAL